MTMTQQEVVDSNYEAFREILDDLMKTDRGRVALMKDRQLSACFDTRDDAISAGKLLGGAFSIQKITKKPINLGIFSCR